ncbi:1,4-alpha-glucan branching protein [Streptomyces sp. NPDC047023]|uniref:maltokinase N-terminal cap-like domain-containing protein n=1 Tax=Streptomyces sp. NPDC047023 TaxID=3155139 RepID=UPI0034074190
MAVIHRTTMSPGKLELLAAWMPSKPWYRGGDAPQPAKAGGFRLDDPEGEVGIEFMVVTDTSGGSPVTYQVPMTYRGAPLASAADGLIGTSEHGVLGTRWIYDGAHDPVLVGQLLALLAGAAEAQDQNESGVPDRGVEVRGEGPAAPASPSPAAAEAGDVTDTADATVIAVGAAGREGPGRVLTLTRVLRPGSAAGEGLLAQVLAPWTDAQGTAPRGTFATLRDA